MPSSHLILCHPLILLPPIPPSIRVFSNESTLRMRWPKYWSFSFSIISSKEHPGLISFRMDWLDLLAVQVTLKSLLKSNQYYFIINHNKCMRYLLSHFSYVEIKASDQIRSVAQSCPILCDPMNHSTPGLLSITNSWTSLKLMSIESVMLSSHLILCRPLLLPPIPPSMGVFSTESTLHMRWPKYWSFSFSIIRSKEIPGLISFRMD